MSDWRPSSGPDVARQRAELLRRARDYFDTNDVLAVDTPTLSRSAGSDPNIESLAVRAHDGPALFLHTSPEFCMKRLLASGYPDIYSICRVYRDGERGRRHALEFTMVEWYRLGFGLDAIVADTAAFIAACLGRPQLAESVAAYDYADVVSEFGGIDLYHASIDELAAACKADAELRNAIGTDRDAWLDLLVGTVIAPQFASAGLTVVRHYPASQGALARVCPDDPRVADRFEIFCGDVELANGYVELTDANEQRRRIENELERRSRRGQAVNPIDTEFLAALEHELPACAGVAVGVERLHMTLAGVDDIDAVTTFGSENS